MVLFYSTSTTLRELMLLKLHMATFATFHTTQLTRTTHHGRIQSQTRIRLKVPVTAKGL